MKLLIMTGILCAVTVCAPAMQDKKAAKTASAAAGVTIPKDAVKNPDGTYSFTDKAGKKWLYRSSPFGVLKTEVKDADGQPDVKPAADTVKVTDRGDTFAFERSTPFGPVKWEKKKSELTDGERKIVDDQNQKQAASPDAK